MVGELTRNLRFSNRLLMLGVRAAVIAVLLLSFDPLSSTANAQDICSVFPAGYGCSCWSAEGRRPPAFPGQTDICSGIYSSPDGKFAIYIQVDQYKTPDVPKEAARQFSDANSGAGAATGITKQPTNAYGEPGYAQEWSAPNQQGGSFLRGCYGVLVTGTSTHNDYWEISAAVRDQVRQLLLQLDQKIQTLSCPGSSSSSTAPASSLGVSLGCQTSSSEQGLVTCTASPVNQLSNAVIVYDWSFDGATQSGVSGSELTLRGVQAGDHTATVVARDTANSLTSQPDSVSLTISADGTSSGGSSGGTGPTQIGSGNASNQNSRSKTEGSPFGTLVGLPVAIILILLGAIGWTVLAKLKRSGASPSPATPEAITPGGVPRLDPPQSTTRSITPPAYPPEIVDSILPMPPSPPRPTTLPETLRETPPTLKAAPPTTLPETVPPDIEDIFGKLPTEIEGPEEEPEDEPEDEEQEEELLLEADKSSVAIRGDGLNEKAPGMESHIVTLTVTKLVNGLPAGIENDVTFYSETLHPKKIRVLWRENKMIIVGLHVGNLVLEDKITIWAQKKNASKVSNKIEISVKVSPLSLQARIHVQKRGFVPKTLVQSIPRSCWKIEGVVNGTPGMSKSGATSNNEAVNHARVLVEWNLDNRGWFRSFKGEANPLGFFNFPVPREIAQVYGADVPGYLLPQAIVLELEADLRKGLDRYIDQAARISEGFHYNGVREQCAQYPSKWFQRLCLEDEGKYSAIVSSLMLLSYAIFYLASYERDFSGQRNTMVKMAVDDAFASIVGALLTFSGITEKLWVFAESLCTYRRVIELAWMIHKVPGSRYVLSGLNFLWKLKHIVLIRIQKILLDLEEPIKEVLSHLGFTSQSFYKAGLWLDGGMNKLSLSLRGVYQTGASAEPPPSESTVVEMGTILAELMISVLVGLISVVIMISIGLSLLLLTLFLVIVLLIKAAIILMRTGGEMFRWTSSRNSLIAWLDQQLSDKCGEIYSSLDDWVAKFLDVFIELPFKYTMKDTDLGHVFMSVLSDLQDLEEANAKALTAAYYKSVQLAVPEDWSAATDRVRQAEVSDAEALKSGAASIKMVEDIMALINLVGKLFQMFQLCTAFFAYGASVIGQAIIKYVVTKTASGESKVLAVRSNELEKSRLAMTGLADKLVAIADVSVKGCILAWEIIKLELMPVIARERVELLYRVAEK